MTHPNALDHSAPLETRSRPSIAPRPLAPPPPLPPDAADPRRRRTLRIGLLGLGTVGAAFCELARALARPTRHFEEPDLTVTQVLVRDASTHREGVPSTAQVLDDPLAFDPESCDAVVEALGGVQPALSLARRTLTAGVPFVTANKALIAEHGDELQALAERHATSLRFEASVAAGLPLLALAENSLHSCRVERIDAVLNGTSNHVLSHLGTRGGDLSTALNEARRRGFAERDASLDLQGIDAAQKTGILARAFGLPAPAASAIEVRGIQSVRAADCRRAEACGYVLRPVVHLTARNEALSGWVAPTAVPLDHPLARVGGVGNGVLIVGDPVGEVFLSGSGAGGAPTAASLLDDVLATTRRISVAPRPVTSSPDTATAHAPPRSPWLVLAAPHPGTLAVDRLIAFLHTQGLAFRTLRDVRDQDGHALVGLTTPQDRKGIERLLTTLRTVAAVHDACAFRSLPPRG